MVIPESINNIKFVQENWAIEINHSLRLKCRHERHFEVLWCVAKGMTSGESSMKHGVTQEYIWEYYGEGSTILNSGQGTLITDSDDNFILDFDTETRAVGRYSLVLTLDKDNYEAKIAILSLTILKREIDYDSRRCPQIGSRLNNTLFPKWGNVFLSQADLAEYFFSMFS